MCFFQVKRSVGHISGMVGPIDVKRKGSASVGYWVNYVTLTFDLTHDLWFFKVKFQNSCIWEIVIWLMWNKKKANQLEMGWVYGLALWPHPWPWPYSLKVKVWNSPIWGMGVGALIDMERKGYESIIHDHDCDLWVTMVGWVDVSYIDWGDFRRRRAVDISSFDLFISLVLCKRNMVDGPQCCRLIFQMKHSFRRRWICKTDGLLKLQYFCLNCTVSEKLFGEIVRLLWICRNTLGI